MPSFAQHFRQQEFSDCDLSIRLLAQEPAVDSPIPKRCRTEAHDQPQHVAVFPAHQLVLCTSRYFRAQVRAGIYAAVRAMPASSEHSAEQTPGLGELLSRHPADIPISASSCSRLFGLSRQYETLYVGYVCLLNRWRIGRPVATVPQHLLAVSSRPSGKQGQTA